MHIDRVMQTRRALEGKETSFFLRGRRVPHEKISRGLKRQHSHMTSPAGRTHNNHEVEALADAESLFRLDTV
jgi:hypothetical protein